MNKFKIKKEILIPVLVGFLFLGVGLVMGGGSNLSFTDKIAKNAGISLSERIYGEVRDKISEEGIEEIFGASGTDHYFHEFFNSGLTQGGVYTTSTSGALMPLTVKEIQDVTLINATLNQVDSEIRFPASTSLGSIMSKTGDTRTWFIRNASTTSAMDLKVASSTGIILNMGTTTNTIFGDTSPNKWARVTLTRIANTDFIGLLDIYLNK